MLLDRGADPLVPARQARWNLVSRVLRSGNLHTLETLLQRGVFLRVPHTYGFHTVLTDAAVGGYAMVDYVLAKGYHAEPDSPEVGSALYTAVTHVDVVLVGFLFEKGLVKNLCTIQEPMYPMDLQDEPIYRSILGKVTSPTGDVDAVAATMNSLLRHDIKVNSGNRSACLDSLGEGEYKPWVSGPNFQFLLDRGADPFCDGGPDQVLELLSLLVTEGAKPELQLILKRLNESSISFEEIERIVARVQRRCNEDDDLDLLPLLHRACCRKKYREIMPASWYA